MVKIKGREKVGSGAIRTVSLIGVDMPRGAGRRNDAPYGPDERARDDWRGVLTLLAFIAALAVFGVLSFAMPKPDVSQIENRPLEKAPAFSAAALFGGSFTDDFSRYYSDTFPWREWMIEKASDFKSSFGVSGENGDSVSIHYGVDTAGGQDDAPAGDASADASEADPAGAAAGVVSPGAAGTDTVVAGAVSPGGAAATTGGAVPTTDETAAVDKLEGEGKREGGVIVIGDAALEFYGFAEKNNAKYAGIINSFDEKYRGAVRTTALVAPTNIEFKLPDRYKDLTSDQRAAISFIYGKLNDDVVKVDVYDSLRDHANEYVYFRTDHHWTQLGAYYAYRDYCKALGLPHTPLLSYGRIRLDGFLGSFYNSIGGNSKMKANPDHVLAYAPVVPYEMTGYENSDMKDGFGLSLIRGPDEIQIANKYVAFSGGDLPVIHIKMQSNTGRRLIIFKESFANAFIPFLTENYDEIIVVDFRYYEGDVDGLIAQYGINEALFLNYVSAAGSEKQVDRLAALFK
ncbi:MAG: hypothetical protein LBJ91_05340 [Clostridiales Family XIII bacterium]|jgi:hypothetical protein|nr:hypothetical protein [Clostridiales Family XIII bacterium]